MTKQLTPAEELRVLDKAATVLAEHLYKCGGEECLMPGFYDPYGKCRNVTVGLCTACIKGWAVNKAIKEMEASK